MLVKYAKLKEAIKRKLSKKADARVRALSKLRSVAPQVNKLRSMRSPNRIWAPQPLKMHAQRMRPLSNSDVSYMASKGSKTVPGAWSPQPISSNPVGTYGT